MNHDRIVKLESRIIPIYNQFDMHFYEGHILLVRKYSTKLASELNCCILPQDLAALLHDIGLFYQKEDHNLGGAKKTEELLLEEGFREKEIKLITRMIRNHCGQNSLEFELEDKILRSADGMSHISEMPYLFHSYLLENNYSEAKNKTREKILFEMKEKITIPLAKKLIYEKYELALALLDKRANKNEN